MRSENPNEPSGVICLMPLTSVVFVGCSIFECVIEVLFVKLVYALNVVYEDAACVLCGAWLETARRLSN